MGEVVQPGAFRRTAAAEPQSFADEAARARLSEAAIVAFRRLAELWKLSTIEASSLLGVSPRSWDRMKKPGWHATLGQDQLTRISAVVGVFKGLQLLFADDFADRWPRLVNAGALFEGRTPIGAMIQGGIPRMLEVRRHVDALRGGL